MSAKEVDRFEVIQRFIRREITRKKTAELLILSERQVKRLRKRVNAHGAKGLIHGNRGKKSNHAMDEKERTKIEELLRSSYPDFKPTFASEKLRTVHKMDHDPKTIRSILIDLELWKPRKKTGAIHRSWRPRREMFGELVQFDGSYHHWFEDRDGTGENCVLAAIDDATGRMVKAEFAAHEGVFPVFAFWKAYLITHGKPRAIYLDKFSTYKMNSAVAKDNPDLKTQLQRAMDELQIELIFANSPQAKGRVERLFETMQDRFVKELRLAGISHPEQADVFLCNVFIPEFNKQFGVDPVVTGDAHRPLTNEDKKYLDAIFSRQEERTIQNDFTFAFKKQYYQLTEVQPATICKKDVVIVEERLDGSICVRLKNRREKYLNYQILPARPKRATARIQPMIAANQKQSKNSQAHQVFKRSLTFNSQRKEPVLTQ